MQVLFHHEGYCSGGYCWGAGMHQLALHACIRTCNHVGESRYLKTRGITNHRFAFSLGSACGRQSWPTTEHQQLSVFFLVRVPLWWFHGWPGAAAISRSCVLAVESKLRVMTSRPAGLDGMSVLPGVRLSPLSAICGACTETFWGSGCCRKCSMCEGPSRTHLGAGITLDLEGEPWRGNEVAFSTLVAEPSEVSPGQSPFHQSGGPVSGTCSGRQAWCIDSGGIGLGPCLALLQHLLHFYAGPLQGVCWGDGLLWDGHYSQLDTEGAEGGIRRIGIYRYSTLPHASCSGGGNHVGWCVVPVGPPYITSLYPWTQSPPWWCLWQSGGRTHVPHAGCPMQSVALAPGGRRARWSHSVYSGRDHQGHSQCPSFCV